MRARQEKISVESIRPELAERFKIVGMLLFMAANNEAMPSKNMADAAAVRMFRLMIDEVVRLILAGEHEKITLVPKPDGGVEGTLPGWFPGNVTIQ